MRPRRPALFSVIIPTLQRSQQLHEVVSLCASHDRVGEVIVINNAVAPLEFGHTKVKVLQQEQNIYVNPAWNLGVAQARHEFLAILNDDLIFDPALLDLAARTVARPFTGMVGIDPLHLNRPASLPPKVRIASEHLICGGYGMFMCLRRRDYVHLPDEMKIWGGDNILYRAQKWPNRVIMGPWIRAELGTTSSDPVFADLRASDARLCDHHLRHTVGWRWWHRLDGFLLSVRRMRHRLLNRVLQRP